MRALQSWHRKVGTLLALLMSACAGSSAECPATKGLQGVIDRVTALEANQGERECGDDLRRLLSDARTECSASNPPAADGAADSPSVFATAPATAPADEDNNCSSDQLKGAIKAAEHAFNPGLIVAGKRKATRSDLLARMLDRFRCEVLYLDGESEEAPAPRLERLSDMVQLPTLPKTRYIIMASTRGGEIEARHRADVMRHQIESLNVPADLIEKSWVYPFDLFSYQIRKPGLLPQKPNETSELTRAVWACRVSC